METFDKRDPVVRQAYIEVLSCLPELREIPDHFKALALPRKMRCEPTILSSKPLPKLIGVLHINEFLRATLRRVDNLPKNSQVAVEGTPKMNYCPGHPPAEANTLGGNFFDKIAAYAEKRGHSVIWLERSVRALGASWENSAIIVRDDRGKLLRPRFDYKEIACKTALWRSCVQSRTALSHEWKSTDLLIVGALHALHLAGLWQRKLTGACHTASKTLPEMIALFKGELRRSIESAQELEGLRN